MDVDVLGGLNVKKIYGDDALAIFIMPPSIETLRQRLLSRNTDSIDDINKRIDKAAYEISFAQQFDHRVVNDVLATAIDHTERIIKDFIEK